MTNIDNKKIVIFICTLDLGGAERQAILLANELEKNTKATVEVWAFSDAGQNGMEMLKKFNIKYKTLNLAFWNTEIDQEIKDKLTEEFKNNNIDIIMPFTYWPNYFCGCVWKQTNAKVCLWNQRDEGFGMRNLPSEFNALQNVSKIVSNSQSGKDFLIKNYNVNPKDCLVIHNGIEMVDSPQNKKALREKLGLKPDQFIGIMIANINERKDHVSLISAWDKFMKLNNVPDALLIFAGKKAEAYYEVETLTAQLGLEKNILTLDFINNTTDYLFASDVGILSSKTEGLPNVIMEYMSCSLPVVATNLPGCRELLGQRYPLLADIGNVNKLVSHISLMYKNKIYRKLVGWINLMKIKRGFSIPTMVSKYLNLLNTLLN